MLLFTLCAEADIEKCIVFIRFIVKPLYRAAQKPECSDLNLLVNL
jgi:hypothetical protein